jgi:hypothetical protein
MLARELFESADNDMNTAAKASSAFHLLSSAPPFTVEFHHGRDGVFYGCYGDECGISQELDIPNFLILVGKQKAGLKPSGAFCRYEDPIVINGKNTYFTIYIDIVKDELDSVSARKAVASTNFMSIFKHEFIHFLDSLRGVKMGVVDALRDGPKKYLMAGPEFNARFHDLAHNWTSAVREMITSRNIEDIESLADIYDITGDFKADLKILLSNADASSKFFLKHLNKEKRESIISLARC